MNKEKKKTSHFADVAQCILSKKSEHKNATQQFFDLGSSIALSDIPAKNLCMRPQAFPLCVFFFIFGA